MKSILRSVLIIAFFLTAEVKVGAEEIDNIGLGHFSARALSPFLLNRPGVAMVQMPIRPEGTWTVGLHGSWGNIWNYEPGVYTMDGEFVRIEPRVTYIPVDHVELGICMPISGRMGGFADEYIEKFHKFLHLSNASRNEFPRDRLLIEVIDSDGNRVTVDNDSWGVNDMPIFVSFLLTKGTSLWPAISGQLTVTIPIGDEDELQGLGTPVYELGTMLAKRIGASGFVLYLGSSVSYSSKNELIGIPLREVLFNGLLGVEYQCDDHFSMLAQYFISSPPADNFYEFSDPINELNLGFKWRLTNSLLLELSMMENMFNYRNSTDIGMNLGLTQSW